MFAVSVTITLNPGRMANFLPQMRDQARNSLEREPGCHQFDICTDTEAPDEVFLYEIYDDKAAFGLHLASRHFKTFDAAVAEMVAGKEVRTWQRIA